MLFFGFLCFDWSLEALPAAAASAGLLWPKTGVVDPSITPSSVLLKPEPILLLLPLLCCSWILPPLLDCVPEVLLVGVSGRGSFAWDGCCFGATQINDTLVPMVGGPMVVARGLALEEGASLGSGLCEPSGGCRDEHE